METKVGMMFRFDPVGHLLNPGSVSISKVLLKCEVNKGCIFKECYCLYYK
jgi:hypothetical protein